MKPIVKIVLVVIISVCQSVAQTNSSGIYKTWQDYKDNKLSFVINCDHPNGKIRLHHFFSKNYIDLIQEGKEYRFNKDSIFGYRDDKHNNYRFYKNYNHEYKILENNSIVIYVVSLPISTSSGKTNQMVPTYFFSKGLNGHIFPLTILNLKRAFADNLKFHDMLDVTFGGGESLSKYDSEQKLYDLNFILQNSSDNKN
jgi:hypothetical protein